MSPRDRLAAIALALPRASRLDSDPHTAFRVGSRTFAWYLENHHGDEVVGVAVKAPPGEAEALVERDPVRYYRPSYLGPRGWVGIRLDVDRVDWDEVGDLVAGSHALVTGRRN